jgi:hypothetical protein
MKLSRITIEQALFFLILLIALGIRILRIADVPLSDYEAANALQAFQVMNGEGGGFSPGPAYPLLTGMTFFLLSDDNFYARIWPILAGCCLVIFPYLIRSLIGRKAALIMAIGLALDPSFTAFSRIAGNEIMAIGFGAMALGLAYNRRSILAGIFGGLMLLSGPSALQGLIAFGTAIFAGYLLARRDMLSPIMQTSSADKDKRDLKTGFLAAASVILVLGTLFFLFPEGLGSLTSILPAYLSGWVSSSGITTWQLLAALVIYNPIVLIFSIVAVIQGWRKKEASSQWLSLWAGTTFVLVFIYPGREVFGLAWLLVPLWGLAAIEIAKYFRLEGAETVPALGQAALIVILMALSWLNLAGLNLSAGNVQAIQLRWAVVGGTVLLAGITTLLIGLGWDIKTAKQGLVWGLLLGFGLYGISSTWALSQLRPNGEQELFAPLPVAKNTGDFQITLGDLSEWRTGIRNSLDVVLTTSAPSLRWEMRDWTEARFLNSIPIGELPSVIITREDQPEPNLSIGYRGQDFAWWAVPGWEGVLPDNWPNWLVFRTAAQEETNLVLWARVDLFPGGVLSEEENPSEETESDIPFGQLPVD